MGLRFAAFFAGYQPKNTPITKQTAKASITDWDVIRAGLCISDPAILANRKPKITPIIPPITLSTIDSTRNWRRMSLLLPPIDILRHK